MFDKIHAGGYALYLLASVAFVVLQDTVEWVSHLPDTTLAGLGLLFSVIGGLLSYLSEVKTLAESKSGKQASLRASVSFAIGVGLIVGLLSYAPLIVERKSPTSWLALILISGFVNQTFLALVKVSGKKRAMRYLDITQADLDEEDTHIPSSKSSRTRTKK